MPEKQLSTKEERFEEVFARLKNLMQPLKARLEVKTDEPGHYYLNTHSVREDGYVYAFGSVQIKKNYVSYHLMPVYARPELLQGVSDELKKTDARQGLFQLYEAGRGTVRRVRSVDGKELCHNPTERFSLNFTLDR